MKHSGRSLRVLTLAAAVAVVACGDAARDDGSGSGMPDATGAAAGPAQAGAAGGEWPAEPGAGINLRRERAAALTGAAAPEVVIVTARGPRYDSLEISLTIHSAGGDTLWADGWNSRLYFEHDPAGGRSAEEVATIVQAHVDSLLHDSRFSEAGLPPRMRGDSHAGTVRESLHYHLAELDWRNRASLTPAEPTPATAYDRIVAGNVVPERVEVVSNEVLAGPTYWYHAGGEASYVIGWSVREHAFVRIFSCC
jgi:hypothetical protein